MTGIPDTCPDCGHDDLDIWTDEVETGRPQNMNTTGAVAPNYATEMREFIGCPECGFKRSDPIPPEGQR